MLDASTSYGRTVHTGLRRYLLPRPDFLVQIGGPDPVLARRWRAEGLDGAIIHCGSTALAAAEIQVNRTITLEAGHVVSIDAI